MLKHCPTLDKASQCVLVDVKGAWAELSGTSSFNTKHVKFACSVALDAVRDPTLTELYSGQQKKIVISCFYRAQVDLYKAELDKMATSGVLSPDEPGRILACTVDSSKRLPADFTIVDFVQTRPSGFLSNPHRLRTTMNHARHATLLILSSRLFTNASHHHHKVRLLQRLYDDAASRGGVVTKHVLAHENPLNQEDNNPQPVKPEKQTARGCKLCGNPDHGQRKCPDQVCVKCREQGHEKRDCPQQTCSDCGKLGHHNFYCPEQTCSHCFGFGHRRWRDCPRSQYTRRHKRGEGGGRVTAEQ